jgi:hypothetical protein
MHDSKIYDLTWKTDFFSSQGMEKSKSCFKKQKLARSLRDVFDKKIYFKPLYHSKTFLD